MKKIIFSVVAVFLLTTIRAAPPKQKINPPQNAQSSAVTYTFSGGRFGDNLLAYIHAKWIAYRYKIPLLYKPFDYSDQLALHTLEQLYHNQRYATSVTLGKGAEVQPNAYSTLYVLPYFPHSSYEHHMCDKRGDPPLPHFRVNFDDQAFKAVLRQMIKPLYEIKKPEIPKNCTSVALHMRRGLAFDGPSHQFAAPHKEPPLSYYISQIRVLSNLYAGKPLYVHLFTDDLEPQKILGSLRSELTDLNIVFGTRESGNSHTSNVLDDFFAMRDFDCLIRPESNYSICVELIGDFEVVCSVENVEWENNFPRVSKARLSIKTMSPK